MRVTVVVAALAVVGIGSMVGAQKVHKPIASLRWTDGVRVEVEGVSDSSVHVDVTHGVRIAVPRERVDYFREWLTAAELLLSERPAVARGEYLDMAELGTGQIRVVRRVFPDSSRYLVSFYATSIPNSPIIASVSAREFTAFVTALAAADTAARRLSRLSATWDERRR